MTQRARLALCCAVAVWIAPPCVSAASTPVRPVNALVYVDGKQVKFERLGIAYNDPVAPANDPGLRTMLDIVNAQLSWQPGTRFAAVTRADGVVITLTVGSTALAVDGTAIAMPFAPFYVADDLYVPLLPLAKALHLGVRGFKNGYVLVPQVVSIRAHSDSHRTIVQMQTSAPAAYRSSYDAHRRVLSISFPGFGTNSQGTFALSGRDGIDVETAENGPPGYPTTTVSIAVKRGVRFAAHRSSTALAVDAVLAKSAAALRFDEPTPALGRVTRTDASPSPAAPRPIAPSAAPALVPAQTPTPAPTQTPAAAPSSTPISRPQAAPTPSAVPASTATSGANAPVSGTTPAPNASAPEPVESGSPSPTPTPAEIHITDIALNEIPNGGTRVTLTMSGGPVNFEWHRLDDPDNRYWLDIRGVTLNGPSQTMTSALPFVKTIRITQFSLEPDRIVRIVIEPTQPINVNVGAIAQSGNQMGIQIERTPPAADAAKSGVGTVAWVISPTPPPPVRTQTQRDLVVIDPGHGGNDPGSMNSAYGLVESKLTLDISLRLRNELQRQGWRVILTRDADYEVGDPNGDDHQELQSRCDVANAAGARVFVSVHINSSVAHSLNGTTTYYWKPGDRGLAQAVQNALVAADGIKSVGVRREEFYVIHHTVMPAVLVETAFLSNSHDATLLQDPAFLEKLAQGIARGITDYTGGPQAPL